LPVKLYNNEEKKAENVAVEERFAYLSDEESEYEDTADDEWSLTNEIKVKPPLKEGKAKNSATGTYRIIC